jgi:hypothetical protein
MIPGTVVTMIHHILHQGRQESTLPLEPVASFLLEKAMDLSLGGQKAADLSLGDQKAADLSFGDQKAMDLSLGDQKAMDLSLGDQKEGMTFDQ